MTDIISVCRQEIPAMRFIGIEYGEEDRKDGNYSEKWLQWHRNGLFDRIRNAAGGSDVCHELYEDGDACVGLMRTKRGEPFRYWIGMFVPKGTAVPDEFDYLDFPEADLGAVRVTGKEDETTDREKDCLFELGRAGLEAIKDSEGAWWCLERYGCPGYAGPDEKGNVILDICYFIR